MRPSLIARLAAPLALLACLQAGAVSAATYTPATVSDLISAIHAGNVTGENDLIDLGGNTFTLIAADNGSNGLPVITDDFTIKNGVIERASSPNEFRFFEVAINADLSLEEVTLRGGSAGAGASGGAILVNDGGKLFLVDRCRFENNTAAGNGGAIALVATAYALSIRYSTFVENTALGNGGAISLLGGTILEVGGSTFSDNDAANGGGVAVEANLGTSASVLLFHNSTLTGNSAAASGGALALIGSVSSGTSSVDVSNVTISGNVATSSGGGISLTAESGISQLSGTIVAGNSAPTGPDLGNLGLIVTESFNLIGDDSNSSISAGTPNPNNSFVGTSVSPLDPLLGPLQDNGGPTETMAPASISTAINNGTDILGTQLDQRGPGYLRTRQGTTDIGAVEAQACDVDADLDGSCNDADNCPTDFNPDQADEDNDGTGDLCESICRNFPDSCDDPLKASLQLNNRSDDGSDSLKLVFSGAVARSQSAFGDPTQTTETTLCLYYDDVLQAAYEVAPSATLWVEAPSEKGWKYSDSTGSMNGVTSFRQKAGDSTTARNPKILIKGKGLDLPDPAVPVGAGVARVTAQVVNSSTFACFGVDFDSPFQTNKQNTAGTSATFKGKLP
jgi:hypothetical protein